MKVLTLYLMRNFLKQEYTIGNLFATGYELNGKKIRKIEEGFLCNIIEDKFRGNDLKNKKVYGETCIPEGNYEIKMTYSAKYKKELPQLMNVPFFEGIRIHSGNSAKDSEGCLIPGMNKEVGKVLDSKFHTDIIITKIKQYDLINIVIKNSIIVSNI